MMQLDTHDDEETEVTIRNPLDIAAKAQDYYDGVFKPRRVSQHRRGECGSGAAARRTALALRRHRHHRR